MRRNPGIPITNPQAELLLELRSIVFERFVSDVEAARHFDVSASYMSSILNCKKPVPERIAKALGYELRWVRSSNTNSGTPTGRITPGADHASP